MSGSNQSKKNVEDRRDAGIAKMLKTPPKPHKDMKKGKAGKVAKATRQASAKPQKSGSPKGKAN